MPGEVRSREYEPTSGSTDQTAPEEPRKSLREIAEESWSEIESGSDAGDEQEPVSQQAVDDEAPVRDAHGRFAPKGERPGEAAPPAPSPDTQSQAPQPEPGTQPPTPGSSSVEPPVNWSAQDRQTFAKQTPEGQAFLLRRHSEMEGDYQRRVQATAQAAQFTEALAPIFTDPVVQGSLQQAGINPYQAIEQWAGFHKRAMSQNPAERVGLLREMAQRMGVDPAAVGQTSPQIPGLTPEEAKDPAIKFIADQLGQALNGQQALRNELQHLQTGISDRQNAETLRVTKWGIDSFADEKGQDGRPLRPHFDTVLPEIIELFRINPNRDINEAYQTALWMSPKVRTDLIAAERTSVQQREANQRAANAARSNVRGRTVPVTGKQNGAEGPKSLRETIEASADEIGF